MEALKAIKIIGNQNDGRAVFLFLPNTGFKISCATPNWRIFLFNMSKQLLAPGGLNAECVQVSVM